MNKMSEMLIAEADTRALEADINEKAIKVSIRHHFCNVDDNEMEIFETLFESDCEDDSDFPYLVWQPFENMSNGDLCDSVDSLRMDIARTFK